MKKILLLNTLVVLISTSTIYAQTLMDYVLAQRGDTLVIKDYTDMGNQSNSLYKALLLDTNNVPAGRVYELQAGGWYPLDNTPTTSAQHPTVIIGSDGRMVATNKDASSAPPLISGHVGTITNTGGITANGDLTIKNCALIPAANNGTEGWLFTGSNAANLHLTFDNCLFEHTLWVFVYTNNPNCNVTLRNCYFVNMSGHSCRRTGGVFDNFANIDTLLVENCTHIMSTGSLYRFRATPYSHQIKRIIINHNTFINNSGSVFMNPGCQDYISLTSNMFVNCNVQPFPGIASIDIGELDLGMQPMGFVNVYPDSTLEANSVPRRFYVANNNAYWDPYLANCADTCNLLLVNGKTGWLDQHILMNDHTQAMFNNDAQYPLLTEGTNYSTNPGFKDPANLLSSALVTLKIFSIHTVDTTNTEVLPDWRLINTGPDQYVNPDWPIPVDLSYSNADLLTGGLGGFPIGDLNWFPTQKLAWLHQRTAEYAQIEDILSLFRIGISVSENISPLKFMLQQNYPNPFNPSTTITFCLPRSGSASLKVYNMLGREIATLLNGYTTSGAHEVQFDATNLASGVYFYKLTSNNFSEEKKMMIVK
jgi:hypothetical protein